MILMGKEFGIEDFLKSLSFITPKGTDLEYFITPFNSDSEISPGAFDNLANQARFTQSEMNVPGVTDTKIYTRKATYSPDPFVPEYDLDAFSDGDDDDEDIRIFKDIISTTCQEIVGNLLNTGAFDQSIMDDVDSLGDLDDGFSYMGDDIMMTNDIQEVPMEIVTETPEMMELMLNESWGGFPKNTFFHFKRGRV